MKVMHFFMSLTLVLLVFTQCKKDILVDEDSVIKKANINTPAGTFTVTVENVSNPYDYFEAGAVFIPEGKSSAGPALPGDSFKFSFQAGPSHKLSFATMYGWSNDGFYAPDGNGISLYSGDNPVTGDITSQVMLWDSGSEVNQMPGAGNQHDGADTDEMVRLMSAVGDGYDYGTVSTNIKVMLEYNGNSMFTLTIENLGGSTTPVSPIAWVVHSATNPIFEAGTADYGHGLEDLAETGNAAILGNYLSVNSGYVSPVAPVLWVLHDNKDNPVFSKGTTDYGMGLETLAETGNPGPLNTALMAEGFTSGFQAMKTDGTVGPLFPGQKYVFTIEGNVGQSLSFASMLGASNDDFFSTGEEGIKLSNGSAEKDITHLFEIYDAGTEINEYPGCKIGEGINDNSVVQPLMDVKDGFIWPEVSTVIKVTIHKN